MPKGVYIHTYKHPLHIRNKISMALRGKKRKPLSEDHKMSLRISHLGQCRPHTEQTKLKIGNANRGRKLEKWQIELLRKVNTGKKISEATRLKMRIRRGELASNWKGGIDSSRTERSREEYKQWRKAVFERDNYTCQECEKRGVHIEADHYPIPWKVATEKEKYDISNGRTLCRPCHMKTFKETRLKITNIINKKL